MENRVIRERLDGLRKVMGERGIDYYLIPTSDFHSSEYVSDYFKEREYFSGFTGSNGTLVVSAGEALLWTDGRYFIQAESELEGTGIVLCRMMEEGVPTIPEYLASSMGRGETLGFDGRVIDTAMGLELEEKLGEKNVRFACEEDAAGLVFDGRPELPCHRVTVLSEELCGLSVEEKLAQVRGKMRDAEAEYLMLSKLDDLMWLFNIRGGDVECNPVALSYGFLTMSRAFLFIQGGEMTEEALAHAKRYGVEVRDYGDIVDFLRTFPYEGKVLCDRKNLNYLFYKIIAGRTETVFRHNPTECLKAVKNPVELANIREVYVRDSAAVTRFIFWLKRNAGRLPMTEVSAAEYMDGLRRQLPGFLDLSFPTICGYKENAAMMHYEAVPGSCKQIEAEGMLLIDSGGQYMGGTTDVTRTVVLGEISREMKKEFTLVAVGMLRLAAARFLHGCTGRNLDILARGPLWDAGIDYKCGTGHGVGYILNVHEGPQNIRWRFNGMDEAVIEEGMLVSDEPGVYKEGSHGIRTENILAAKNGEKNGDGQFMYFDTLTYVPIDLEGIDTAYMQPADVERLNEYHRQVYEKVSPYLTDEEREWLEGVTRSVCIQ